MKGVLKFVVYSIVFMVLFVYLFETLNPSGFTINNLFSSDYTNISQFMRNPTELKVGIQSVMETIDSWGFLALSPDFSPNILKQSNANRSLETTLLSLLAENPWNITPEQYAVVVDLFGLYNLSGVGSVNYYLLSPHKVINLSLETFIPNSPEKASYPPSAEISFRPVIRIPISGGGVSERYYYRGYSTETRVECISDPFLFEHYCGEVEDVILKLVRENKIGQITAYTTEYLTFTFPKNHTGCLKKSKSHGGFGSIDITVSHCEDGIKVSYSSSTGHVSGPVREYNVEFKGYHGEKNKKITVTCTYHIIYDIFTEEYAHFTINMEKTIEEENMTWSASLPVGFVATGKTTIWCEYSVSDVLEIGKYKIPRKYVAGSSVYSYYTVLNGEDEEELDINTNPPPNWVKRQFNYSPKAPYAEDLLISGYAETIKRALNDVIVEEFNTLKNNSKWEAFFGKEDEETAKRILEYFYLVQIPLGISPDENNTSTRLQAFLFQKGNRSTISSLYTFFENTTFIYVKNSTILFTPYGGESREVNTNLILFWAGTSNIATKKINTSCGPVAVAELAYYRQPSFQQFLDGFVKLEKAIKMHRGYNVTGILFEVEEKTCST